MDVQAIELALEELQIPLPEKQARTRSVVDRLAVLDVPLRPIPSTQQLADTIRGCATRGEGVDPVALAREAREAIDNVEAARAVQLALNDAVHLHELAFRGGGLIPVVGAEIEKVYIKVRGLPNNTPTTAGEAVHADEKARKAFVSLEELAARHSQLRQLHRLLIADDVAQRDAVVLFGDTKRKPAAIPSRVQPAEAAGPREAIARLRWLSQSDAEAWVPTAVEIDVHFTAFLRGIQQPLTGTTAFAGTPE